MKRNICGIILAGMAVLAAAGCNFALNADSSQGGEEQPTQGNKAQLTAFFQTEVAKAAAWTLEAAVPTGTPQPTMTPTHDKVTITVTKNTNCRTGPEKQFDLVGIMMVGETAEAIGRNEFKTYWVIRLPSHPEKTCWLWYEWATVTGNSDALPIIESPPTPTFSPNPDFTYTTIGFTSCGLETFLRFKVENIGNTTLESYHIGIWDSVNGIWGHHNSSVFADISGCTELQSVPAISPGGSANAYGKFWTSSSGHLMKVTVDMYTSDNSAGIHLAGNFNFTAP